MINTLKKGSMASQGAGRFQNKGQVILVDDEELVRRAYQNDLRKHGYEVRAFESGEKALPFLTSDWPGILITDVIMPGMDGLTLMKKVREIDADLPVVVMTGRGDIPMAVQAVRDGAFEFLEKPFSTDSFLEIVRHSLEKRRLILEIRRLRSQIVADGGLDAKIIGLSPSIQRLREIVKGVSETNTDVLIFGETGTGKDLVARCLHENSPRAKKNFVAINCGALPETIIESELFGHEAGAFTGANQRRIGKFEFAQGGTVYLDEIESMPLHLQVRLLRVLQERVIERVGSNESVPVDLRIIAATKEDLKIASDEGRFRMDLYYRLNVVQIHLPAVRERPEDIPLLFEHFLSQAAIRTHRPAPTPARSFLDQLKNRPLQGNVRELKNEAEKFLLDKTLGLSGLKLNREPEPEEISAAAEPSASGSPAEDTLKEQLLVIEKRLIEGALTRNRGNITKTHEALGIPRQTLCSKMKKFNLKRVHFRDGF
ncbi:MAG: sigma-54-dependent transcriptional regulator [Nitrospinaceae bacterium]